MSRKMLIDATHPEETRVVVVDGNRVEEFDFETVNKRQLAGNIYLAKVTRVEPSLQAAFVDYGGNRHGFLAFSEIHPDYYQIPVADREALKAEERAFARAEQEAENGDGRRPRRGSRAAASAADPQRAADAPVPAGMEVIDPEDVHSPEPDADAADDHDNPTGAEVADTNGEHDHGSDHTDDGEGGDDGSAEDDDHPPPSEIESLADNDVSEEISAQRRPRRQKYKIQEVIKVRQILLVQVLKEERGNKGAALTTYLSLAGRYCVLMPNTARGGGISRKITQAADRKKLKEIASQLEVPEGAGLIIRTAGARRTGPEIQRDYEYLMRLWEEVRGLTLRSIAPAPIYQEGDLIKRTIRDLYSRDIDEVLVEGEAGYQSARDFMRMIMPDHARQVKRYDEPMPLFARYQVESFLAGMFNPVVQLKSGGYIVIGITEALVAIDVNSGRATKEGSIEETALKTNLEAADEVARQLRLRDLAGLIVIDFIDMDERRNNAAVEKRLKERLKSDRARIQVGRISGFGLMEMSRQRLHPGMLESTTQPCPHCHGTGLIRSDDSLALTILRAIEEEGTRKRSREVLLKAPVGIVNYLVNHKREHVALIEARYGMAVRIDADPDLVSPDYTLERFKTATRSLPAPSAAISGHAGLMGELAAPDEASDEFTGSDDEGDTPSTGDDGGAPAEVAANGSETGDRRKKRRRRRRRPGSESVVNGGEAVAAAEGEDGAADASAVTAEAAPEAVQAPPEDAPSDEDEAAAPVIAPAESPAEPVAESAAEAPAKPKRVRKPRTPKTEAPADPAASVEAAAPVEAVEAADAADTAEPDKPKARRSRTPARRKAGEAAPEAAPEAPAPVSTAPASEAPGEAAPPAEMAAGEIAAEVTLPALQEPAEADATPTAAPAEESASEAAKPRRRGWWNRAG